MNDIDIAGTPLYPEVHFHRDGNITVSGRSMHESPITFYEDLIRWVASYAESPQPETMLDLYIDYFNTNSIKCMLDIIRILVKSHKDGGTVLTVNWRFHKDDEEMEEVGDDYATITGHPFNKIRMED